MLKAGPQKQKKWSSLSFRKLHRGKRLRPKAALWENRGKAEPLRAKDGLRQTFKESLIKLNLSFRAQQDCPLTGNLAESRNLLFALGNLIRSSLSKGSSVQSRMTGALQVFLTAEWRALAMLNYEVDASFLLPYVPAGTEVDCWSGKAFVSLVGFRFLNTRVFGVRFPFHCNFNEVNLRFYVRRRVASEVRRGVVFIREIVPRWAIAAVARGFYSERYLALPMSHRLDSNSANITAEYGWKSKAGWNKIEVTANGQAALPEPGSHQQFITEHYWGYARGKNDTCIEYRVEHLPWRVWLAAKASFEGDAEELYGKDFATILKHAPSSAFLADGSKVAVFRGRAASNSD